jgi:uncharacterized protein YjbJ (UPF0337 family)
LQKNLDLTQDVWLSVVGTAPGTDSKIDEGKIKAFGGNSQTRSGTQHDFVLDNIADLKMS